MRKESEDNSYRKGLMLGLTMAEIVLLLIFILLLLIAPAVIKQTKADKFVSQIKITDILNVRSAGAEPPPLVSPIDSIIRILEEGVAGRSLTREDLIELKKALEKHKDDLSELTKMSESIALSLPKESKQAVNAAELKSENMSKEDFLKVSEHALSALRGYGLPPCWLTQDGSREYLFAITMYDDGIVVRDLTYSHRMQEKQELPLRAIKYEVRQNFNDFTKSAASLIEYAKKQKQCRHAIVLTDKTTEKNVFKRQYLRLHQEFYADFKRTSP